MTEWYLNGTDNSFILKRPSWMRYENRLTIERKDVEKRVFETSSKGGSSDHALIKCAGFTFILSMVQKPLGPSWSRNIGIEYRSDLGRIPTRTERISISEILSFIFGTQLLNVGHTCCDQSNVLIERVGRNPWGGDAKYRCAKPEVPPMNITTYEGGAKFESIAEEIIPEYLKLREKLKLDQVLWRYWMGSKMPIGTDIPIYHNGIEILANNWFKINKSRTKGVYMKKRKFYKLLHEEFASIDMILDNHCYKDEILNKIKNSYRMGVRERLDQFLDELDIKIGNLESEALVNRNSMIHDYVETSGNEERINKLSYAYRTMFHRILLKILGYSGRYVDYTVEGCPEKDISEVVGE
ncbi:MAG: hypothetical protein ACTSUO_04240 [Candidatus Thorarchaeota archaeon]